VLAMEPSEELEFTEPLLSPSKPPITRQSSKTSTSPEPPPDYESVCNAFLLNGDEDDESFEDEGIHSDIAALGIQFPNGEFNDDVCLLDDEDHRRSQRSRNRLPSIEAVPAEKPPRFTKECVQYDSFTMCKVCLEMFKVTGRLNLRIVKCPYCEFSTPIKEPPVGKKFVRCPCNCLLIVKQSAMRIQCPREECKKIINLHTNRPPTGRETTGNRLVCGHCTETFVMDVLREAAVGTCPHCRLQSAIGPLYRQRKLLIYLVLCIIFGILSFICFVVFYHLNELRGLLGILGALFSIAFAICLYKLVYYIRFRVSNIIETNIPGADPNPGVHETSNGVSINFHQLRRLSSFRRSISQGRSRSNTANSVISIPASQTENV